MREPLTEVLRTRCTPTTKAAVAAEQARDRRTESDMVRILVEEALAARAEARR
jgi:hypothetical protein